MSNLTDFFPSAGGGGGVLKQHRIITSGTFDLTTLGIGDGDNIGLFLVSGGTGGLNNNTSMIAGYGGNIWQGPVEIGTAGTITAVIGAGSANYNIFAGETSITGGGITGTITTGVPPKYDTTAVSNPGSPGYTQGAAGGYFYQSSSQGSYGPQSGINGYGNGGGVHYGKAQAQPNSGNGGSGGPSTTYLTMPGASGVIIIYYS